MRCVCKVLISAEGTQHRSCGFSYPRYYYQSACYCLGGPGKGSQSQSRIFWSKPGPRDRPGLTGELRVPGLDLIQDLGCPTLLFPESGSLAWGWEKG